MYDITPEQAAAEKALTAKGWRFSNWFAACEPDRPELGVMLFKRRVRGVNESIEVDPDGSCNGKPLTEVLR